MKPEAPRILDVSFWTYSTLYCLYRNYMILGENCAIRSMNCSVRSLNDLWSLCAGNSRFSKACFNLPLSICDLGLVKKSTNLLDQWKGRSGFADDQPGLRRKMGVSKNSGTPKWMVYKGKPYFLMDDLGVFNHPYFWKNTQMSSRFGKCLFFLSSKLYGSVVQTGPFQSCGKSGPTPGEDSWAQ